MLAYAIRVPTNVELEPSVADEETCHSTLHAVAPPTRMMLELDVVVSDEPTWKTHTSLALPWSISVPVMASEVRDV